MNVELSFVTEDTLAAKVIRWFTHSDFSHVDIIVGEHRVGARSDHPVGMDIDTWEPCTGVQNRPMDYAKFTRDERIIIPCLNDPLPWLYQQIGKPYDKYGLFNSFLFDRPVPWWDENQWWCSELGVVLVTKAIGKRCVTPASRVTPNDLYIFAGAFGECRTVL